MAGLWKHAGEQPQTFLYSYDNAGNILSLLRTGSQAATLSFTYPSGRSSFSAVTPNGQMTRNATSGTYSAQCSIKPTTIPTDFPSQFQRSKAIVIFTTERNFGPSPAKVP